MAGAMEGNKNAEKWTEEKVFELGSDMLEWFKEKDNIFFQDFFVNKHGLFRSTRSDLKERLKSFRTLMEQAKELQEIKLADGGTKNRLNAAITKFMFMNNHNYSEKAETKAETTVKNDALTDLTYNELYELKYGYKPGDRPKGND